MEEEDAAKASRSPTNAKILHANRQRNAEANQFFPYLN